MSRAVKICVVGTGYVGLVTGTCFAEMGYEVVCVDIDAKKISGLKEGIIPIYEPGLTEMVVANFEAGRLTFSTSLAENVDAASAIFIAVGTPPGEDGSADLKYVLNVAREIGATLNSYKVIVNKSTVPVGTADRVRQAVNEELKKRNKTDVEFDVASNPEFLKEEGDAIADFMRPDRIVVGVDNARASDFFKELYAPFVRNGHPILTMSLKSAELTKYAANAMLATRISFMNEVSQLCSIVGADIEEIRRGIGSDRRIGMSFLYAGLGYGGSCFPKDVQALRKTMHEFNLNPAMLDAVENVNTQQRVKFVQTISAHFNENLKNKKIAVWGLSFKPKTDDMREAPSVFVISELVRRGADVSAFDPVAMKIARRSLPEKVKFCEDMYAALESADALLLLTEWSQFRNPDFERMEKQMKNKVIFDGRNQYDVPKLGALGWNYVSIGRGKNCE